MRRATHDLSVHQAKSVYAAIQPTLGFLNQLERRLTDLGFCPTAEYLKRVQAARDALHDLTVDTHYRTLGYGVGRPDQR